MLVNEFDNKVQLPSVAIVILNFNGQKYLQQFLPSIISSIYNNKRIIVADNASTDDSIAYLKNNYPTIEIIINPSNQGFAKGYNSVLKQITSDYYILLNNDVAVTSNWINPIIKLMESNGKIAVCQPKILSYHQKNKFEYAGASGGWIDKLGYPFARGRVFDNCENDINQYNNIQECFWASGAALFVKSSVYHQLNGLDEYFFAHQEEIDFCWRVQLAGYKVFVHPSSVVYHVGGGTLPKTNNKKTYLNYRNNLIMLAKNNLIYNAIWIIIFRLILDGIAACRELLKGNFGYLIAVLKAHVHFYKWLLFHKKQSLFPNNKNKKLNGMFNGLIVWQYFFNNKKTFLEIVTNK